jgi:SepF-like predicted cell division protein (DUF552 family)
MSEDNIQNTPVAGEDMLPDTAAEVETTESNDSVEQVSESAEKSATPKVEHKDGKVYLDGVRLYTRSETNSIAANAQKEAEKRILSDLEVDSLDNVKSVVKQLQAGEEGTLDVQSLRQEVKKREQTVEELQKELANLKTDYALRDHMSKLKDAMPTNWTVAQKDSVLKLMKADSMFALEDNNFYIKNGNDFLTTDGETPDYAGAVKLVGEQLGLSTSKKGVETFDSPDTQVVSAVKKEVDQNKLKTDSRYRSAYVSLRSKPISGGGAITHEQVLAKMNKMEMGSLGTKSLSTTRR